MGTESVASTDSTATRKSSGPRDVIRLVRFFIFNSSFGPKEGEEVKRIIFYHSDNEDEEKEEQRTKQVGLAEAVARFSSVFSDNPCQSMHTQKTKSVFFEPELGYYIVLAASVPCFARRKTDGAATVTEYVYHPENVHDNVLLSILQRGYEMFHFFTGGFDHLRPDDDKALFCRRVSSFFSRYVSTIHLERQDVSDLFPAVHFLTLEASAFLQVQSFVHRIEDEFPCIETCAFFHQGFIAWSGLQQTQTSLLYHYIYTTLLPTTLSRSTPLTPSLGPFSGHQGQYLAGPQSLKDPDASLVVPRIFLPDGDDHLREHHLVVYHALNATMCLVIPGEIELSLDFFRRLDGHLGPRLTHMSADLHNVFGRNVGNGLLSDVMAVAMSTSPNVAAQPQFATTSEGDEQFQFMYYNSFNRAMKSTLPHVFSRVSSQAQCDENAAIKDAAHIISDLESDFRKINARSYTGESVNDTLSSSACDISVKLPNDSWVVAKLDGQRQVYSLVQTKNANLIDVGETVDRMMATEFKNICILEK